MIKLCHDGGVSVWSFVAGAGLLFLFLLADLLTLLLDLGSDLIASDYGVRLTCLAMYFIALNLVLRNKVPAQDYPVKEEKNPSLPRSFILSFVFPDFMESQLVGVRF